MNCKQAMNIISSSESLSISKKMSLYFHLVICRSCMRYKKILEIINGKIQIIFHSKFQKNTVHCLKLEEKIIQKLKDQ